MIYFVYEESKFLSFFFFFFLIFNDKSVINKLDNMGTIYFPMIDWIKRAFVWFSPSQSDSFA